MEHQKTTRFCRACVFLCWIMKLLASFDHVYACLCTSAFVSVSLSEQSFLIIESPIRIMENRLICFYSATKAHYSHVPHYQDHAYWFLFSNCTLSHTVLLKGIWNEQWLYINDVTVDCIKIIHSTNSPLGIRGLHLICSQASKLESRDTELGRKPGIK